MQEDENYNFSDEDIDDTKHVQMVENVLNLDKIQNLQKPSRTEPTLQISEFNLVKSVSGNKGSVHLNELTKVLKGRKKQDVIKKVQSTSIKGKTLPIPLQKPQADRIRRSINYEKSRLQLDRWEALVTSNRAASHLTFPLDSIEKLKVEDKLAEHYPSTWRLKSDLQRELEKIEPKVEEYHINIEDKEMFPLSIEEIAERRKEAAKLRVHQSFKEAKARRQNKIKSKKYHRILRREKIKKKIKEFEELQKTNPEEALKKLEDIEKARAEERFSLRHKGTGQWAKSKQIRAKYDRESRQVLAQQLAISRELTQKVTTVGSDSEDEGIESEENSASLKTNESNPWVSGVNPDKEVTDFVKSYRLYWNEHNKKLVSSDSVETEESAKCSKGIGSKDKIDREKKEEKFIPVAEKLSKLKKRDCKNKNDLKKKSGNRKTNNSISTSEWNVSPINKENDENDIDDIFFKLEEKLSQKMKKMYSNIKEDSSNKVTKINSKKKTKKNISKRKIKVDLNMPSKSKKHVIDEQLIEESQIRGNKENDELYDNDTGNSDLIILKTILEGVEREKLIQDKQTSDIDPNKFMQMKQIKLSTSKPDISITDDNEDYSQRDLILEAFEDDDIAEDFAKEKADEVDKDTPKDIDLNLPGWGSWGGANINPSKRKRKRFILKMPQKMPRGDDNKGSLIINEKAQAKLKPLMVSEVPFPFKTIKDYEASIRAPIGNTFVPETAFKRLIEPVVTTKMGAIIEPITKTILVGKKKV